MSVTMDIKSSERGVIRVFHIDLPKEAVERFTTQAGTGEWPLQYALGAKSLRAAFVEVVDLRDLGDMPLSQYLINAHDVNGADFETLRPQLDALKGHVLILPSQAFDQTEQTLTISNPLRWIGTFNEPKPTSDATPLRSASAKGVVSGSSDKPPPGGGNGFWLVIVVLAMLVAGIILAKLFLT